MLSDLPKFRSPSIPRNPEELIQFLDILLLHENAVSQTSQQERLTKEFQKMYEQEFLTELDEDKFQLIYGAASILRDRILEWTNDPNPYNWPIGYHRHAQMLIRLSDVIDYGAEGDYMAESILTIAKAVIKYFEQNPKPRVNRDLVILESTVQLVEDFYQERKDSAEAIDCVAMLDLLTAVKKNARNSALKEKGALEDVEAAREEVRDLFEGALEDAEAAKEFRINTISPEALVIGGVELLHGTLVKVESNYAKWLYNIGEKDYAFEKAERVLEIDELSPIALDIKINCLLDQVCSEEDLALAAMQVEGLLVMYPKEIEYLYTLGRIRVNEGDFVAIGSVINRLQIADPQDTRGFVKKLLDELDSGKFSVDNTTPVVH